MADSGRWQSLEFSWQSLGFFEISVTQPFARKQGPGLRIGKTKQNNDYFTFISLLT